MMVGAAGNKEPCNLVDKHQTFGTSCWLSVQVTRVNFITKSY